MNVYVQNFGCSANVSDGEMMASMLDRSGRRIVGSIEEADTIILNTCTVKGKTDAHIKNLIGRIRAQHPEKKLVIGGCMPQVQSESLLQISPTSAQIGPHQIGQIVDVVSHIENGEALIRIDKKADVKVNLGKRRSNPVINIVQINEGCLGSCTFCITKLAKPKLLSFPMAAIKEDIEQGLADGCKEVWLTSQDTAAYGKESRRSLQMLMREILEVPGDHMIRIGMMNPDNILGQENEIIAILRDPRVFKFLHIPVQAGSDAVLKRMNRAYTVTEFESIVAKLRSAIPDLSISTDIICGFPGETEEQFNETIGLVKRIGFETINISRYWERPGTASSRLGKELKLNGRITKERSTRLTELFREMALERNSRWVGWRGSILIDEKGHKEGTWIGRNYAYKCVVVKSDEELLGKRVDVVVESATMFDIRARMNAQ